MEWLNSLLYDTDSVAHIILLYSFVIFTGVYLGKLKVFGVSLGVAFILFVGIFVAHFGFSANEQVINFIKDFGLILFVYSVGLQVGPSFFTSFKQGGIKMNMLAVGMVALNVIIALLVYELLFDKSDPSSFPLLVGVMSGAVTNTPGLGAAEESLNQLGYAGIDIATGYACAYPFAILGIILIPMIIKWICKIRYEQEEESIKNIELNNVNTKPKCQHLEMQNKSFDGMTIMELRKIVNRDFICSRLLNNGKVVNPHKDTIVRIGDIMRIVSAEEDSKAIKTIIGSEIVVDWDKYVAPEPLVSRKIVITKNRLNGKTLGQLHLGSIFDVTITRVVRSGTELFASSGLVLQVGDRLTVVGPAYAVAGVAARVGNELRRLDVPNITTMFIGIFLGILAGSIPLHMPGIPTPIKLGLAGGPLVIAIFIGRFGYKLGLVTYTKASANLMIREIGIALFLASVGIKAGDTFVDTVLNGNGLIFMLSGLIITVIPVLIISLIARIGFKMNYFNILGVVAGSCTNPPALAYANDLTTHNAPAVSYSTVYPLTMFLRILTAQLMVLIGYGLM
ncbi:MAG TPA: putative transporter [Bacteroidaceae bacterium]|nr:putative transporter [Bacteroidaceae bacterium]